MGVVLIVSFIINYPRLQKEIKMKIENAVMINPRRVSTIGHGPALSQFSGRDPLTPEGLGMIVATIKRMNQRRMVWAIDEAITPLYESSPLWKRIAQTNLLGISTMTCTEDRGYQIIRRAKRINPKIVCVAGGFGSSSQPEKALENGADIVVIGEGVITIRELMTALEDGSDLSQIEGIAFKSGNEIFRTPPRSLLEDMDEMPFADWELIEQYEKIQARAFGFGIGCPFNCDFCAVSCFYGRTCRHRSVNNAMEYVQHAIVGHRRDIPILGKRVLFFDDDHFAAKPDWTKEFLERLGHIDLSGVSLNAQLRAGSCRDTELMKLLAGKIDLLFFGFEACSDESLGSVNKKQSVDDILFAIEQCKRFNIGVAGMFIVGFDNHTPESAMEMAKFALKHGVRFLVLFIRCPLPDTKDTAFLEKSGRLLKHIPDYYRDCQYVMFKPANMTPEELQRTHLKAIKHFYNPGQVARDRFAGRIDNKSAIYRLFGNAFLSKQTRVVEKYIEDYL